MVLKNQTETVSRLSIEIKQFMNELKKIQEQYEYWNDLKDPQPDIVKEQEEARHYLEEKISRSFLCILCWILMIL